VKSHRLAVLSLVCLLAVVVVTSAAAQAGLPADLDRYIEQVRQDWDVVGLAVAVVKDDSVVYAKGFGRRDLRQSDPVDEHTLFAIGSNTKAFTSAAIGILVDEERMTWDDRVIEHLPWFQLYDPYVTREIRVRDLLSHRSGLGRRGDANWYGTDFDRDEVVRRIRYLEPNSSFRAAYGYQNTMFSSAGEVIEAVAGMTWDDFIKTRIFRPLGMTRSNTSTVDLERIDNVATPHARIDGEVTPVPYRNLDNVAAAGSINSSVREMTNWMRMMLAGGEFAGERILSADVVREVHTPQTITGLSPQTKKLFPSTHFATYGLGWGLRDYHGRLVASHTGGIDGMLSQVMLIPEEQLGVVVLTNTSPNSSFNAITFHIVDSYLDAPRQDWNATFLDLREQQEKAAEEQRTKRENGRVKGTKPSLALSKYVGTYEDDMYGTVTITQEDGGLVIRRHTAWVGDLVHWHYDTFEVKWRDRVMGTTMLTFTIDAEGNVEALEVEDLEDFERVEEKL